MVRTSTLTIFILDNWYSSVFGPPDWNDRSCGHLRGNWCFKVQYSKYKVQNSPILFLFHKYFLIFSPFFGFALGLFLTRSTCRFSDWFGLLRNLFLRVDVIMNNFLTPSKDKLLDFKLTLVNSEASCFNSWPTDQSASSSEEAISSSTKSPWSKSGI